jgi:hypothetical protein
MAEGEIETLPARADALDALPVGTAIRLFLATLGAAAAVESVMPDVVPRIVQRVTATS